MSEYRFKRGEFQVFRAITQVHLGAIQEDLFEDEEVLFDGQTLRRGDKDHHVPNLASAIKAGWLVPAEDERGAVYRPQPSGVQVRPPTSVGDKRGDPRTMGTAIDDSRDLGNREDIRQGKIKKARSLADMDQQVVGRVPTTAASAAVGREGEVKAKPIQIGSREASEIVHQVSNVQGNAGVRMIRASGDVDEATTGDDLEDLLPNAASSGRPTPGVAGDAEARRQERLASISGTAHRQGRGTEPKAVVSASRTFQEPVAVVSASRTFQEPKAVVGSGSTHVGGEDEGDVVGTVAGAETFRKTGNVSQAPVAQDAITQAKIEMIQQFVPGFQWDLSREPIVRAREALTYKNQMPILNAILSIETDQVRGAVLTTLYK